MIALPTVILAFFYGQSRIFFTVARDGLFPISLARVSSRGTPVRITIFTAIVTSVFAGLIPLALDSRRSLTPGRSRRSWRFVRRCWFFGVGSRTGNASSERLSPARGNRWNPRLLLPFHQLAEPHTDLLRFGAGDRPVSLCSLR